MERLGKAISRLFVIGALAAAPACSGSGGDDQAACTAAPADVVAGIETALTVSGGSLADAVAVPVSEDNFTQLVAARVIGSSDESKVAVWATGPSTIDAVSGFAQQVSEWGADINPNSFAGKTRETLSKSDEYVTVINCVRIPGTASPG